MPSRVYWEIIGTSKRELNVVNIQFQLKGQVSGISFWKVEKDLKLWKPKGITMWQSKEISLILHYLVSHEARLTHYYDTYTERPK